VKVRIDVGDDRFGTFHRLIALFPDLDEPVFVHLWGYGDRIVGVQLQLRPVIRRQELFDHPLAGDLHQNL
jgi:hypothetical protein